jgi:glycerol uptake facilitator-like aquaporin
MKVFITTILLVFLGISVVAQDKNQKTLENERKESIINSCNEIARF